MNLRTSILSGLAALLSAGVLFTDTARAEDSPHRRELERRSRAAGLGVAELPLLRRVQGDGAEQTADRLIQRFAAATGGVSTAGDAAIDATDDRVRVEGPGWSLVVHGDGTQVQYRNRALQAASREKATTGARPSQAALERLGRAFVKEQLPELGLGRGETMALFKTAHEVQGRGTVRGGPDAVEQVTGSIVVFTRVIDGVDVVGPGAKISVFVTADGEVSGFDYDWATYERTDRRQAVLDLARLEARARALPAEQARAAGATVRVKRWECGYFDAGARHRDPAAFVQPACAAHHEIETAGPNDVVMSSATVVTIPAGAAPEADARWVELQALTGGPTRPPAAEVPGSITAAKGRRQAR